MYSHLLGWADKPHEVERILSNKPFPLFKGASLDIRGSGHRKSMLGHLYVRDLLGYFPLLIQAIGDCVSFGAAGMVNASKAYRIKKEGKVESFGGITSTEDIYGGSRVLIGKGQISSDGSCGIWAAEYMTRYGTLVRKKYGDVDLSQYSGSRARTWGTSGVPSSLLPFAAEHTFGTYSKITTYDEVCDSLYNGYFITIASNQAFVQQRDNEGFAAPDYNNTWPHQMYLIAYDDEYTKRPGVLCVNSWPENWISGPKRHEQPEGSFWIDAEVLEKRILSSGDCFSFSDYNGYPPNAISPVFI